MLAIPCRSMYAIDSASMLSKALKLIVAAEKACKKKKGKANKYEGEPVRQAMGL